MWQDIRFGLRMLVKSPGFTALALVTLALGIGANTTIFSIVNSVLLQPLPYQQPERIVQVADEVPGGQITSSLPKFNFLHAHMRTFSALAAESFARFQISGPSTAGPAEVQGAHVSTDFFRVLGVKPASGRTFLEEEERPGGNGVAVISHSLWQNRFGGNPAIGQTITVDGAAVSIVGIMPAGFDFPASAEIWLPRIFEHAVITPAQVERGASYLLYWGRLAGGADLRAAQAEVSTLSSQYDAAHAGFGDTGRSMSVTVLHESLVSDVRRTLLVLLGAVAFVLLIASANVANLLLARAIARHKEVAIRASLGASRPRLLVQFLTESVLLAGLGAGLGLLLALWSLRLVTRAGAGVLPHADQIHADSAVLLFTIAVAVLTGVLFGLGPALHWSRADWNETLKAGSRSVAGGGGRLRGIMIVSEVALAVILLSGAGLLLRSFLRLENVNPGFRPQDLLTMRIGLASARYPQRPQQAAFYDRVLERIGALPGVQDAAIANGLPLNRAIGYFFNVEGRPVLEPTKAPTFWLHSVSPSYFQTLGVPILRGRVFTAADNAGSPQVAIINETMARRFWPNEDPIGRHITYARESITVRIIGIAGDVKVAGLAENRPQNELYVSYRQRPFLTMWLITRGPAGIASAAQREILGIDADQPVGAIRTMDQVIAESVSQPRLRTALIGAFAALALILAVIGIGGVVAWSVSQRTNEIGIRMALGAQPGNIVGMIVGQAFRMIGAGLAIGLAGALALTRVLSTFLFGVSPEDPVTFSGVVLLLVGVALAACVLAARRALQVDPAAALRV